MLTLSIAECISARLWIGDPFWWGMCVRTCQPRLGKKPYY